LASDSTALLQVASGLERLMVGSPTSGPLKDSNVAQISAFLYYQANIMGKLEENEAFKNLFKTTIFNQIDKDFGLYIDAMARTKPKSLHHVYEWNKPGIEAARLFKLRQMPGVGLSFGIDYDFKLSKSTVPNKNKKQKTKYKFANKAAVMEAGMPVTIRPRSAERLVFELDGIAVFMPKGSSVTVKSPGGKASTNRFSLAYSIFFSGNLVNLSIKNSGFQQIFGNKIGQALSLPTNIKKVQYSFSPNTIRRQADFELTKAFGGA
jgi:hypothetical protein